MMTVIKRAFTSNLQTVSPLPGEQATLDTNGIQDPTLQAYFAWRRSLMIFVFLVTIPSAGLATYRYLYEDDEGPTAFKTVVDHFSNTAATAFSKEVGHQLTGVNIDTQPITEKVHEAAAAAQLEIKTDKDAEDEDESEPEGENKTTPAASEKETESLLYQIDELVPLVALYTILLASLAVIMNWTRFGFTFRILMATFAFSFLTPILLSFCPWSWWEPENAVGPAGMSSAEKLQQVAEGLVEGLSYLGMLLPTVLSLLPGVQKACIRVKTLLPQSSLPGWFLATTAPFYGLFLLVVSVAVHQIVGSPFVLIGLLLLFSSSLIYGIRGEVFTRPLVTEKDYRQMFTVQKIAGMMTMVAGCLLLYFVQSHEVMGVRLLGLDAKTSVLQPLDLLELFVETIGRAMFMTVFGADVFMRINFAAWKQNRDFQGTAAAAQYDATMTAMEQAT